MLRATLLAPVVGLALAGCQWTSPIQTQKQYDPADGRSVSLGGVEVDNLLVVTDKKGGEGTLVGLGVNNTNQSVQVTFTPAGGKGSSIDIQPLASQQVSEPDGGRATKIPNMPVAPGELLDLTVDSAGVGSKTVQIPVVAPYGRYGAYSKSGTITPTLAPEGSSTARHGGATPSETTSPTPTGAPASPSATASPTTSPAIPTPAATASSTTR